MSRGTAQISDRGFEYIPYEFQYSLGIAALPGHAVHRVWFPVEMPLEKGFAWIEAHLKRLGLPTTAFAACELRSKAPYTPEEFRAFNEVYAATLRRWGCFDADSNPVARSNVCPELNGPEDTCLHAFCYVAPTQCQGPRTFVIAGGAETLDSGTTPQERIVAFNDVSPAGLALKTAQTISAISDRLDAFKLGWADCGTVQTYTVHETPVATLSRLAAMGGGRAGFSWQYCRPPVRYVEYEMDCRRVATDTMAQNF